MHKLKRLLKAAKVSLRRPPSAVAVCPVVDDDPVCVPNHPATLTCATCRDTVLRTAHAAGHAGPRSMYHGIRHMGITDITLAVCENFVCDVCCKWNQAAHGMQHYQYPVGERVGTSYGMDVFYCYGRCVLLLVDTLSEFVHVVDLGSSDGAGEVPLPVYVGGRTGAGRVWRALKPF